MQNNAIGILFTLFVFFVASAAHAAINFHSKNSSSNNVKKILATLEVDPEHTYTLIENYSLKRGVTTNTFLLNKKDVYQEHVVWERSFHQDGVDGGCSPSSERNEAINLYEGLSQTSITKFGGDKEILTLKLRITNCTSYEEREENIHFIIEDNHVTISEHTITLNN